MLRLEAACAHVDDAPQPQLTRHLERIHAPLCVLFRAGRENPRGRDQPAEQRRKLRVGLNVAVVDVVRIDQKRLCLRLIDQALSE